MRELKLGLALGAGGTKGAAHIGVMKVLDEAGLHVDVVAGTSIGALYGGAFAVGRSVAEMEDGIRSCPHADVINFFRHRLKLRHNNRLARRFYEALAGHYIEDLPVKYAATASDIAQHCSVTITEGPIIDAIEASIAIPLIARPVAHQGRYLLDGGFWDSAPVSAAHELGADIVVAVELGHPYTLPERLRAPASWMAARMAFGSLQRTFAGVPFSLDAVSRAVQPGRMADVVIQPAVPRVSGNTPFQMSRCLDAGIEAAREALPAIKALLAGEAPAAPAPERVAAPRLAFEL